MVRPVHEAARRLLVQARATYSNPHHRAQSPLVLRCQGLIDAGKTSTEAAEALGVSLSTLYLKLKDVGLSWPRKKSKYTSYQLSQA